MSKKTFDLMLNREDFKHPDLDPVKSWLKDNHNLEIEVTAVIEKTDMSLSQEFGLYAQSGKQIKIEAVHLDGVNITKLLDQVCVKSLEAAVLKKWDE